MKAQRALLGVGSAWELARFFLVLVLFSTVLKASVGAGAWVVPWLVAAGSGTLVVGAGSALLALFPARYAKTIALLRLGKLLSVFAFVLMVASGALRAAAGVPVGGGGRRGLSAAAILVCVFVLDAAFLAVLLVWRSVEEVPAPAGPVEEEKLPEYHETEVQNFH